MAAGNIYSVFAPVLEVNQGACATERGQTFPPARPRLCRLVHGGGPGVIDADLVRQITRPPRGGIEIFHKVRGGIIIIGTPHSPNVGRRALQGTYPTPLQGLGRFRPRGQHWARPAQRKDFRPPARRNSRVVLGIHGTSARPELSDTVMRQKSDSWHTTSEAVCKHPPFTVSLASVRPRNSAADSACSRQGVITVAAGRDGPRAFFISSTA